MLIKKSWSACGSVFSQERILTFYIRDESDKKTRYLGGVFITSFRKRHCLFYGHYYLQTFLKKYSK